jgi:hypothetical protein
LLIALIVLQGATAQVLYKLEHGRVSSTSDGGNHWREAVALPGGIAMAVWSQTRPEHVIAVGQNVVYVSFHGGRRWMPPWQLPKGFEPTALAILKNNQKVAYLTGTIMTASGTRRSAAWTSRNGGIVWYQVHTPEATIATLADSSKFWYGVPNSTTEKLEEAR